MKWNSTRLNSVLWSLLTTSLLLSPVEAAPQKKPEPPKLIRQANAALQASAINRVEAVYPPQAVQARVYGTVLVEVSIDENGSVASAKALSGHPLLREAAVDAARGWSFKPAVVQGKPVKVLGTLTFTFNLPEYVLRDRAIERLKQQIAMNPNNAKLHHRLGRAYEDNEQFADAMKSYARAVSIDPQYGDAHVALGNLNMKLNQNDAALYAYRQALTLNLTSEMKAAANRAMALIYFRSDRFREAVEPFKQAIAIAPQGSLYFNLGLTYLKLGDKTSAMEQYRLLKDRNSILAEQLLKKVDESK